MFTSLNFDYIFQNQPLCVKKPGCTMLAGLFRLIHQMLNYNRRLIFFYEFLIDNYCPFSINLQEINT